MKQFQMSPNPNIKVKSGKQHMEKTMRFRTENNWESFKNTKSVNSHTIVKDLTVVTRTTIRKEIQQYIEVIVETRFGKEKREIPKPEFGKEQLKRVLAYSILHTLRADGVYREIGVRCDGILPSKSIKKSESARKSKVDSLPNQLKCVQLKVNGVFKSYRIVRNNK